MSVLNGIGRERERQREERLAQSDVNTLGKQLLKKGRKRSLQRQYLSTSPKRKVQPANPQMTLHDGSNNINRLCLWCSLDKNNTTRALVPRDNQAGESRETRAQRIFFRTFYHQPLSNRLPLPRGQDERKPLSCPSTSKPNSKACRYR